MPQTAPETISECKHATEFLGNLYISQWGLDLPLTFAIGIVNVPLSLIWANN